jgi:hypothetical protein
MAHTITFVPSGRGKARCPSDPAYPNGVAIDPVGHDAPAWCLVKLPYPAPECGVHRIDCSLCALQVLVTAAGRPDDPVSVRIPCNVRDAKRAD